MGRSIDVEVLAVAKQQHGMVSAAQAMALGTSRAQIWGRVRARAWCRELPCVFRLSSFPPSELQRAWAAFLWNENDAWLSHRTAVCIWQLDDLGSDVTDISSSRMLKPRVSWLLPHTMAVLPKERRHPRGGLPVTSPSRTLVDLAGVVDEETLERVVEQAFRRKLTSVDELTGVLSRMPKRGRAGTGTISRLLKRGAPDPDIKSELERRALQLFRRWRIPVPQCQYRVIEQNRSFGVVDFAWPSEKVIVEAEGFRFHSGRTAWESDIDRYNALVLQGWRVVRLTWKDLANQGRSFAENLSRMLGRSPHRMTPH
jgi:hypothetical protein